MEYLACREGRNGSMFYFFLTYSSTDCKVGGCGHPSSCLEDVLVPYGFGKCTFSR